MITVPRNISADIELCDPAAAMLELGNVSWIRYRDPAAAMLELSNVSWIRYRKLRFGVLISGATGAFDRG